MPGSSSWSLVASRLATGIGRLDLDTMRPGPLALGQKDAEHPVLELGRDSLPIDFITQDKGTLIIAQAILFMDQPRTLGCRRIDLRM